MDTHAEVNRLRRWWWALAGLQALLLAHLVIYMAAPERVMNAALLALAGLTALLALATFAIATLLNAARVSRVRDRLRRFDGLFLLAAVFILAALGWLLRPEWFYAQLALTTAAVFSLTYVTCFAAGSPSLRPRVWVIAAVGVMLGVLGLRIYALSVDPPIHLADEGWTFSWAVTHLKTGRLDNDIMFGIGGIAGGGIGIPQFYALLSAWLRLVGVGLWGARLFSLMIVLGIIGFSVLAAHNLSGRRTAAFTGGVLITGAVLVAALRIRHDVGLGLALAASLWAYSHALKTGQERWHLLGGLLMGIGGFAHYHAIFLGPAMTLGLYGPRYVQRLAAGKRWPESGFWFYVVGGMLGGACVYVVQILPEAAALQTQTFQNRFYTSDLNTYFQNLSANLANLADLSKTEFLLIVASFGAALWRRQPLDWTLITVIVVFHLALGGVALTSYYLLPLAPLYAMLVGRLFSRGGSQDDSPEGRVLGGAAVSVFVLFAAPLLSSGVVAPVNYVLQGQPLKLPPPAAAQWVRDHVGAEDIVVADHYYFLWLYDYRFVSPNTIFQLNTKAAAQFPTPEAVWNAINPDVFIFDPNLATFTLGYLLESDYLPTHGYTLAETLPGASQPILIYRQEQSASTATPIRVDDMMIGTGITLLSERSMPSFCLLKDTPMLHGWGDFTSKTW